MKSVLLSAVLISLAAAPTLAQERRAMTTDDGLEMVSVGNVQMSLGRPVGALLPLGVELGRQ